MVTPENLGLEKTGDDGELVIKELGGSSPAVVDSITVIFILRLSLG